MLFLIVKGLIGSFLIIGAYGFVGNIINFPLFFLWFKNRNEFINKISYLVLLIYSFFVFYIVSIYFAVFTISLNRYTNKYIAFFIPFIIISVIGAHLLNQNKKLSQLAEKDEFTNKFRVRLKILDVFEFKNKHYLMIMTKYGYTLWVIYLILINIDIKEIAFGFDDFLLKHFLK